MTFAKLLLNHRKKLIMQNALFTDSSIKTQILLYFRGKSPEVQKKMYKLYPEG
jgi:hypothetical protein